MTVIVTVLMASAGAFSASLSAVDRAGRLTDGAIFLDTVMQDLSAQDYENLLAMNGNQFFDQTNAADSQYSVSLTVFTSQPDLLQVQTVLTDLRSNQVVGRVTTLRSRR